MPMNIGQLRSMLDWSSVQDLPVISKWHNFQSLEKALIFYGIKTLY